jgi:hypothetical protein
MLLDAEYGAVVCLVFGGPESDMFAAEIRVTVAGEFQTHYRFPARFIPPQGDYTGC